MHDFIKSRVGQLRQSMAEEGIDALLVLIEENRRYISGFTGEDTGHDESAGALLITPNDLLLLTDSRYTQQAQNECPFFEVITYKKGLAKELPVLLPGLASGCPGRLGYEKQKMTCEQLERIHEEMQKAGLSVEPVGTVDMVEKFRRIKSKTEIDAITSALYLAENAFSDLLEILVPGMTEREAAWALEKRMREAGAQSVSFPVIVAAGANAALPHATPGDAVIQKGQPVLFDWGARLNGYCSDTSRTIFIGKPDSQFETIFTAVYDAQQKAVDAVKPGAYTMDIDAAARDTLKEKALDGYFGHGLGHGVGLAIHEQPSVSPVPERNTRIEEGMVFTIEPGVYIPGWGGVRLENMVLVTRDGAEVLNRLPVALPGARQQ